MKITTALTISITGLRAFDGKEIGLSGINPNLVFNLDEFKVEANYNVETTPEEQVTLLKTLPEVLTSTINQLNPQPKQEFRCPSCSCEFEVDPIHGTKVVRE